MLEEVKVIVESYNLLNTKVGKVDYKFFESEKEECLYYFYPLLERLCREYLAETNRWSIEVYENNRYKTLNSILSSNIIHTEELTERIRSIYQEDGPRNKYMHGGFFTSEGYVQGLITDVKQIVFCMMIFKVLSSNSSSECQKD
ncbi:hypothetical protein R2F61_01100 [Mollicutes bacterium LVI A0078]|nr:hypothetical protein RZE84_01100 [Mollicutes bacterium LVI A0075]WOO91175.1 hypothetical protein R2F61_01100 [Mollicutes bacterium LVI A0078]